MGRDHLNQPRIHFHQDVQRGHSPALLSPGGSTRRVVEPNLALLWASSVEDLTQHRQHHVDQSQKDATAKTIAPAPASAYPMEERNIL